MANIGDVPVSRQPATLSLARIESAVRSELRRCGMNGAFDITIQVSSLDFDVLPQQIEPNCFDTELGVRRCIALGVEVIERDPT